MTDPTAPNWPTTGAGAEESETEWRASWDVPSRHLDELVAIHRDRLAVGDSYAFCDELFDRLRTYNGAQTMSMLINAIERLAKVGLDPDLYTLD